MIRIILFICFYISLSYSITPVDANGQLHVDSATGKLTNEAGDFVQLRGISSHGIQWFGGMINETSVRALQEHWGADVLRISMYIQEDGYEKSPSTFLNFMDTKINLATEQGLYVIIDFHMLAPGNPLENIEHARDFFSHMSEQHSEKTNIFYEICNEPNDEGGSVRDYYTGRTRDVPETIVTWDMIKEYADDIVPIIRSNDDHNIILVGTPTWCQEPNTVIGNRIDDANLMYTAHFYAASHKEWAQGNVREALENNIPLFITEFGTQTYSGDGANDFESTKTWFALLDSFGVSRVNWNFSGHNFSGAVFTRTPSSFSDYDFYINDSSLKNAGLWIKNELQKPDSWDPVAIERVSANHTSQESFTIIGNELVNQSGINASIILYSIRGEQLWETDISSEQRIEIPNLFASGIYLVSVSGINFSETIRISNLN